MEAWWKTWHEVNQLSRGKKVVLYGRSEDWIPKTLVKLNEQPQLIVDRNPVYHGTAYRNIPVISPEEFLQLDRSSLYVVITSGVYEGIVTFLVENGFQSGTDFCNSPEYRDYSLLEDIRNYRQDIIVSCSDYHDNTMTRYSRAGGGLYKYSIGPNTLERLVKGSFRQIVRAKDSLFAIEFVELKLYQFDCEFKIQHVYDLDAANYCGLDYDPVRDQLILVNASQDTISLHRRDNFELVQRVAYSDKNLADGVTSQHHVNDCCVHGDYLYVTYFSHSGNWKRGIHDGGVSEFHLDRLQDGPTQLVRNLWKPHSPKMLNGELCYLDSMRGRFYTNDQVVAGEFPGFARGLEFDGRFYYIGQSEDMYMSRRFGTTNNIMLNAGFFLFDNDTKASRFYPMLDNMNVHDLLIVDK